MTQINPLVSQVEEAADFIQNALGDIPIPETMVILGSGFKSFADKVDVVMEMSYSEIPHFHTPKVSGHGTSIIFGTVGDKNIALFQGESICTKALAPTMSVFQSGCSPKSAPRTSWSRMQRAD